MVTVSIEDIWLHDGSKLNANSLMLCNEILFFLVYALVETQCLVCILGVIAYVGLVFGVGLMTMLT